MGHKVANFRTNVLQLPEMAVGDRLKVLGAVPNIYAVGEVLLPTPSDWPHNAVTTGFFFLDEAISAAGGINNGSGSIRSGGGNMTSSDGAQNEDCSTELVKLKDWIASHPRPVVVNFGSMACLDEGNVNVPENSIRAALQLGALSLALRAD